MVRSIGVERKASIAGNLPVGRQTGIVVEDSAQLYFGVGHGIVGRRHRHRKGAKSFHASAFTCTSPDADKR